MTTEREKFEAWWASNGDDEIDTKVAAWLSWQACAEQKDYECNTVVKLKMDAIHSQRKQLKDLRDKITECWYLSYPDSKRTPESDDKAAKQRIFNLYQDLICTRDNYRFLSNAYNKMDAEMKK